ncbi:MAG: CHRD domain-containing protein [Actinobacteria bacterium]|nr:CHRD domain-containing protein [Actinomycetota bacterium]
MVKWFGGVVLVTALLVVLALGSSVAAQQTSDSKELQFKPQNNSGVSGTATLRDVDGGLEVTLNMQGLPEAGIEHINHFHAGGSCAGYEAGENIPITIPLETIVANADGTGSATTTLDGVTLDQVMNQDQERIIVFHTKQQEGVPVPPPIACADVNPPAGETTTTKTEQTMMKENTEPLPKSGGSVSWAPSVLLPAVALFLGLGVLGFAIMRRR